MTKDEARSAIMGAISMALKDTTLQQGFEIICKNLAELEKENEGLKIRIDELAKMCNRANERHDNITDSLTKAKEITRELMNWYWETDICSDTMPQELRQKAEQFLSEVEK